MQNNNLQGNIEHNHRRGDVSNADGLNFQNDFEAMHNGREAFFDIFSAILVEDPTPILFDCSINKKHLQAIWVWIIRDIMPELQSIIAAQQSKEQNKKAILANCSQIGERISKFIALADKKEDFTNKLNAQLGSEEIRMRLGVFQTALKYNNLLGKAVSFGQAANRIEDEQNLGEVLQSMPLQDPKVAGLMFHAIIGEVKNPGKLILAIAHIIGSAEQKAIQRAGFEPLLDALLAHAQNQTSILLRQTGYYIDVDLMCTTISRFHKLVHAASGYVELDRLSRLGKATSQISRRMADIIEPRLREVSTDVRQSLRKPRMGEDGANAERLLQALNGIYLLAAVREARESLALNALFDKVWSETGQSLEILIDRNLEDYKANIGDKNIEQRLDMGIKMAAIRFGEDYAKVLRQAKEKIAARSA